MDAAAESSIMERRPLLLTPVPHEQPWATAAWAGHPVEPPTPSELQHLQHVTLMSATVRDIADSAVLGSSSSSSGTSAAVSGTSHARCSATCHPVLSLASH
jgi:hypothetical protein